MKLLLASIAVGLLSACATVELVSDDTVIVQRNFSTMSQAFILADQECRKQGKRAKLRMGNDWAHSHFYDCVN